MRKRRSWLPVARKEPRQIASAEPKSTHRRWNSAERCHVPRTRQQLRAPARQAAVRAPQSWLQQERPRWQPQRKPVATHISTPPAATGQAEKDRSLQPQLCCLACLEKSPKRVMLVGPSVPRTGVHPCVSLFFASWPAPPFRVRRKAGKADESSLSLPKVTSLVRVVLHRVWEEGITRPR